MYTTKKIILLLTISLFIVSCSDNKGLELGNNSKNNLKEIVIQERNPTYPLTNYDAYKPEKAGIAPKITKVTDIDLYAKDFIGHGYRLEHYPFEDARNIGFPVIDMEKYLLDNKNSLQSKPLKRSYTDIISYADYNRYEKIIDKANTVKSGFKISLGLFSVGSRKSRTTVFKGSDIQERNKIRGELAIRFYDREYEFLIPIDVINDISANYLNKSFLNTLYGNSANETFSYYGGFVLVKFISGAQAFVLYDAELNSSLHAELKTEAKEESLDAEIDASLSLESMMGGKNKKFEIKNTVQSVNTNEIYPPFKSFELGRKPGTGISVTERFTKIKYSVQTLGGFSGFSQFTIPKDINTQVFDLSAWCNSLANKEELTIAKLPSESLIPVTSFIEENNLKERFNEYYQGQIINKLDKLQEPCIMLRKIVYNDLFEVWQTSLVTRYGEHIKLKFTSINPSESEVYVNKEAKRLKNIYPDIKILGMPNYYITSSNNKTRTINNACNEFDMSKMNKFKDPKTGKLYLLTTVKQEGLKIGYTLYNDDIINDYTFEDQIKNIPLNNSINLKMIKRDYYLIAL